jgi:hypothetical protein
VLAVEILDDHERRLGPAIDAVVLVTRLAHLGRGSSEGRCARMRTVRAKPTTGFIAGNPHCAALVVYPWPRRSGATSSSALHMVGVSKAASAARSVSLSVGVVMSAL